MTAQEAVLHQLNRQLKEHQVRYEQATQDPDGFAERSKAKAVVEVEKAVSDALAAIERLNSVDGLSATSRKSLQLKLDKLQHAITSINSEAQTF
jgi:hypothetical protein